MPNITQTCAKCSTKFLVIGQEQKFLAEKSLPLPVFCPACRQKRRLMLRGGEQTLYKTNCSKCGKEIIVAYNPKTVTNTILCKKDFQNYFMENDSIVKEPLPEI